MGKDAVSIVYFNNKASRRRAIGQHTKSHIWFGCNWEAPDVARRLFHFLGFYHENLVAGNMIVPFKMTWRRWNEWRSRLNSQNLFHKSDMKNEITHRSLYPDLCFGHFGFWICSTGWFKQNCFRSHCSPIVPPSGQIGLNSYFYTFAFVNNQPLPPCWLIDWLWFLARNSFTRDCLRIGGDDEDDDGDDEEYLGWQ